MTANEAWFRRLALGYLRDPHECVWRSTGERLVGKIYDVPTRLFYKCVICGLAKWM